MMIIEKVLKVEPSPSERTRRKKSRIFLWDIDKNIVDMVTHRFNRDVEQFAEMIPEAVQAAGLEGPSEYTYFSRACTCGASPGFIADTWLKDEKGIPYDLHITYSSKKRTGKPVKVEETHIIPEPDEGMTVDLPSDKNEGTDTESAGDTIVKPRRRRTTNKLGDRAPTRRSFEHLSGDRMPFAAKRSYQRKITLRNIPIPREIMVTEN